MQGEVAAATAAGAAAALAPVFTVSALELIENATDLIYTHDLAGKFTYLNAAALRATGYTAEEALQLSLPDVVAPAYVPTARAMLEATVQGRMPESPYPLEIVSKDGRQICVEVSTQLLYRDGKPIAIHGIARNVTDRKRAETALRESESKFRALAETAASAIFIYQGSRLLYVNPASEVLTGYSREELMGMDFWELVAPEFKDVIKHDAPAPSQHEFKFLTKSGAERWVHFAATRIPFNNSWAILATVFDITEKKRSSEELMLQKAYLEQLFESAPEGVVVRDNNGVVVRANREFCRMFRYTPQEVRGRRLDDLIVPPEKREEAETLTRYGAEGGRFNVESVRRRKDNTVVQVSILGTPVQTEGGQVAVYVIYRDITERRRGEQKLRESEAKFRAVADTAASAIYIHTGESFLYVNRAAESISGYTREELLAMEPFALVHPDWREVVSSRFLDRQEGKDVPARYEFQIVTKNGEYRWLDFSASRIEFSGQSAVLATAFDITARKRSEQLQSALYRIAERANAVEDLPNFCAAIHRILSELVSARNFYIALYDEDRGILSWPYFVDEEDEFPPEPRGLRNGLTEYVLRTGQPLLATPEVFQKLVEQGEVASIGAPSIDWLGVPLKLADRTFGVLVAQSYSENVRYGAREQDILTFVSQHVAAAIAHKRDQEAVRESEERYRSLFQRAAYGIYRASADGHFLDVNPALEEMLGYSRSELLRLNLANDVYVDPEERKHIVREFQETGRSEPVETRWKRKDGKIIMVRLTGRAALSSYNELQGYEVIVEDITERRALEEQLRHAQKMDAVGRLAGGIAHDFNNLLTVIKGYSELLLTPLDPADPMRAQLEEVRKAADRAAGLTRQLLAFSRRQVLAPKVLDLNTIVSGMDKLLRRLLGEDVELRARLDAPIGRVKADPGQLEQVIMNLAVNARDAMPKGGRLLIETANFTLDENYLMAHRTVAKPGPYVMLAVTDNGQGMSDEVRSRVFEPFFTTKERGTGLGLSTVYGIVKQSGGYVWVYSEVGKGSTFKVYLPQVDEAPAPRIVRPADMSTYRGTETILVVEDEDGVRALVRQMLQQHGYTVLETRSAGEALIACERCTGPIHLLLSDVVLAQISGPDLAKRLVALRPDIRVLFMSGYTEDAIVSHGVLHPGIAYLQKPFTSESLSRKVREVLDGNSEDGTAD